MTSDRSAENAIFGKDAEIVTEAVTIRGLGDCQQGVEFFMPLGFYCPTILRAISVARFTIDGTDTVRGVEFTKTPRLGGVRLYVNGKNYGRIDLRALGDGRWFDLEPNQLLFLPDDKKELGVTIDEPCVGFEIEVTFRISAERNTHGR